MHVTALVERCCPQYEPGYKVTLLAREWPIQPTERPPAISSRMTKALLEKDGVNWREKLPPIPTVPISAQKRWSAPSAAAPAADAPPGSTPQGHPGESTSLAVHSPSDQQGDGERGSCHPCLVCLQPEIPRNLGLVAGSARACLVDAGSFDLSVLPLCVEGLFSF